MPYAVFTRDRPFEGFVHILLRQCIRNLHFFHLIILNRSSVVYNSDRYANLKGGTFVLFADYIYFTMMHFHQFLYQGKADSRTFHTSAPVILNPVKTVKYFMQFVFWNADSGIRNFK